jgi:hypothetical protein
MQSHRHIDYLVEAANHYRISWWDTQGKSPRDIPWGETKDYLRTVTDTDSDTIGSVLVTEQLASVSYRYPDDRLDDLPGYTPDIGREYEFKPTSLRLDPRFVLKAIAGYEYQSCEHPGWDTSEAKAIVETIKEHAISAITHSPEVPDMFWEIDPESINA